MICPVSYRMVDLSATLAWVVMETTAPSALEGAVLARLERIAALERREAPPGELLAELRELLRDAEASTAATEGREEVVGRLGTALHGT